MDQRQVQEPWDHLNVIGLGQVDVYKRQGLAIVGTGVEVGEEVELPSGLLAFEVGDRVDRGLVNLVEGTPVGVDRVEGTDVYKRQALR